MKAERMRLAGRIIAYSITGFGGAMLIGEAVGEFTQKGWAVITEATPTDPGFCWSSLEPLPWRAAFCPCGESELLAYC